jgi:hypothetical protein
MADITSANSKFYLTVPDVFPVAQLVQGYATDDAFASEEIDVAEVMMGVDGRMSSGYIPVVTPMEIVLQADSPSILGVFEAWHSTNLSNQVNYLASGLILMPSIGTQYQLANGVLLRVTPFPQAKKVLQPVRYRIVWESYKAQPVA